MKKMFNEPVKNLCKAVSDYNEFNKGGVYDPHYGKLMYNKSTNELWTDEFYALGHTSFKQYDDPNIVDIVYEMAEQAQDAVTVNTTTVSQFIIDNYLNQ